MVKNNYMDGPKVVTAHNHLLIWILFLSVFIISCKSNSKKIEAPINYHFHHELRLPTEGEINSSTPTLLLLHGYGSNEKDLFNYAQYFDPTMLVVCPRAPITVMENKYSWYPLNRVKDTWKYDANGVLSSCDKLLEYVQQIIDDKGVDPNKIFLGGFSQGAIMSLGVGLQHPEKIAGIIALSGEVYPEINQKKAAAKNLKKTKLFISHGLQDEVLPVQPIKASAAELKEAGMTVSEHYYNIAHSINSEGFNELLQWLRQQLNK